MLIMGTGYSEWMYNAQRQSPKESRRHSLMTWLAELRWQVTWSPWLHVIDVTLEWLWVRQTVTPEIPPPRLQFPETRRCRIVAMCLECVLRYSCGGTVGENKQLVICLSCWFKIGHTTSIHCIKNLNEYEMINRSLLFCRRYTTKYAGVYLYIWLTLMSPPHLFAQYCDSLPYFLCSVWWSRRAD